jgi:hypothetical protein
MLMNLWIHRRANPSSAELVDIVSRKTAPWNYVADL